MRRFITPEAILGTTAAVVLVVVAVSFMAVVDPLQLLSGRDKVARAAIIASTTTTVAETTTTTAPQTTTAPKPQPIPAVLPVLPPEGFASGAESPDIQIYEERMVYLLLDPGPVDGKFDTKTRYAVEAVQKMNDLERTGIINEEVRMALGFAQWPEPLIADGEPTRIEVDMARQVLYAYKDGDLRLITSTSTGSGKRYCNAGKCQYANTPDGRHEFLWRVKGWRKSDLGQLYNPVYFTKSGVAIHGYSSIPTNPASHGCVRIPMHIAEYFPTFVATGDPIYIVGGSDGEGGVSYYPTTTLPVPGAEAPGDSTVPPDAASTTTGPGATTSTTKPGATTAPVTSTTAPVATTSTPGSTTTAPATTTTEPVTTTAP